MADARICIGVFLIAVGIIVVLLLLKVAPSINQLTLHYWT